MNRLQGTGAALLTVLMLAVLMLAGGGLAGCTAARDMTQTPEEAAAAQPSRVAAEGASDEFPNLAEVPSGVQPQVAEPERDEIMDRMADDRARATYSDPAPLVTAAPADPFSTSVVISGDSVTTDGQVTALPATGGGRLAAIIFFSHGSADLDPRDRAVLRDLAALHRQRGGSLRVVGHASSRTHNATPEEHRFANFEMSMSRAETVQAELLRMGVAPEAVRAEAVGDAEPVYHEFMPSGEAGNRRVEIFLEN